VGPRTLYVREGCHLCEEFLLALSLDLGAGFEDLAVVDVDRDPELALRFGLRVPVLEAAGVVVCEGIYDRSRVRESLRL
jgi:hypothetical protein